MADRGKSKAEDFLSLIPQIRGRSPFPYADLSNTDYSGHRRIGLRNIGHRTLPKILAGTFLARGIQHKGEWLWITGSAVALHCCKVHLKSIGKMENSTLCKIVTPENFILKFGIRDYAENITYYTNFHVHRFSGGFSTNRWNITLLWLFFLSCPVIFFSFTLPARTARPIFAVYGSNDVVSPKDGPFWG